MCAHTAEATTRSEIFFVVCVDVSFMILKIDKDLYNFCAHKSCRHSRHTKSRERSMESQSSGPGLQPDSINSMRGSITKWIGSSKAHSLQRSLAATCLVLWSGAKQNRTALRWCAIELRLLTLLTLTMRLFTESLQRTHRCNSHGLCELASFDCDFTSHSSRCLQRSHDRTWHGIQSLETIHWINRGDARRRLHRFINQTITAAMLSVNEQTKIYTLSKFFWHDSLSWSRAAALAQGCRF